MAFTFTPCPKCSRLNKVSLDDARVPICGQCKSELGPPQKVQQPAPAGFVGLVEKSPLPVVVDFWAPWCGPCRSFAPTFESAADELAGKVVFVKVNTDEHPQIAAQYEIRGIPTLIVFRDGQPVDRVSGALPPDEFREWIAQNRETDA